MSTGNVFINSLIYKKKIYRTSKGKCEKSIITNEDNLMKLQRKKIFKVNIFSIDSVAVKTKKNYLFHNCLAIRAKKKSVHACQYLRLLGRLVTFTFALGSLWL